MSRKPERKPKRSSPRAPTRSPGDEEPSLRAGFVSWTPADQLRRVKAELDWDQEIGAVARIAMARDPALLSRGAARREHR